MVSIIFDFAIAAFITWIAQILRAKVRFFQKMFIPASLLGGLIALILGDQFLNILHWSEYSGDYTWTLVVMSFVAVGLPGITFNKAEGERLGSYFFYKLATWALQFSLPVLLCCLVLSKAHMGVNDGFGLLLAAGFMGGHGTAAAVGSTFEKLRFVGATDIAMTFATAGIITGIFGGIIFIKWATKRGYTQYIKDFNNISEDLRTGLISRDNRDIMGRNTISSISLDPLFWHLAIMLMPTAAGIWFCDWLGNKTGVWLPEYAIGFLIALVMAALLKPTGVMEYVDFRITDRIAGTCTDFIVFFGVAKIKISIIVEYAVPLAILLILGIIICWATVYYFGPRMNRKSWFERSIFVYGYSTGVFAIGMLLLRICDPNQESGTLPDTGFVESIQTFFELIAWSVGPYMMMSGQGVLFGLVALAIVIISLAISKKCGWWYHLPLAGREAIHEGRSD
jgi:ESS family glutamate:Na+ symporter